jgi:hypothetical protein
VSSPCVDSVAADDYYHDETDVGHRSVVRAAGTLESEIQRIWNSELASHNVAAMQASFEDPEVVSHSNM